MIVGSVIFVDVAVGPILHLLTRQMHQTIESQSQSITLLFCGSFGRVEILVQQYRCW